MVGDGVIAESYISFKITWKNPGGGQQPIWDQNKQEIELHTTDVYPDLLFSKAFALATYYKYSTADKLIKLISQIDAVIDTKFGESDKKTNETAEIGYGKDSNLPAVVPKYEAPATITKQAEPIKKEEPEVIKDEPAVEPEKAEIDQSQPEKPKPNEPGKSHAYTVIVHAEKFRMIDAQGRGSNISIKYRVSDNLIRKVGDEELNNMGKIKATVILENGEKHEIGAESFDVKDEDSPYAGMNLLVQILPSVELNFTPSEPAVTPRSEESDYVNDLTKNLRNKDSKAFKDLEAVLRKQDAELRALKAKLKESGKENPNDSNK